MIEIIHIIDRINEGKPKNQCEGCTLKQHINIYNGRRVCIWCHNHYTDVIVIKNSDMRGNSNGNKIEIKSMYVTFFDYIDNVEKKYSKDKWVVYNINSTQLDNGLLHFKLVGDKEKCNGFLIVNKFKLINHKCSKTEEINVIQKLADRIIDNYIFIFNFLAENTIVGNKLNGDIV